MPCPILEIPATRAEPNQLVEARLLSALTQIPIASRPRRLESYLSQSLHRPSQGVEDSKQAPDYRQR